MKILKKILCAVMIVAIVAGLLIVSAGAAGTIAYGAGTVSASILNIRSGPGTNNSIVSTVRNGTTIVILERSTSEWYKINYAGTVGYVSAEYLTGTSQVKDLDASGEVNDSGVRYRTGPSTDDSIIGSLDSGAVVKIAGIDNGWYKINYNGTVAYMRSDYITVTAEVTEETTTDSSTDTDTAVGDAINKSGTVTADYVRFRTGPSTSSSIIRTLNTGTSVDVLAETNGWYKIVYSDTTGYMSSTYISLKSEETSADNDVEEMNSDGYVSADYVRMRTGPATNYSIITTLNYGTAITVLGETNGWYKISYNGTVGYMSGAYVKIGSTPSAGTSLGTKIAEYCKQFVGYSYVYGGASPSTGFDCSGLMYYVYGQFGYSLQRGASSQYAYNGTSVAKSDLQPGDLVFFSEDGGYSISHVGMYIGNNQIVHASGTGVGVVISDLTTSYYMRVYYGAKRII